MFEDDGDKGNQFSEAFAKSTGYSPAAMTLYMVWKGSLDRYTKKPGASEQELDQVYARLKREAKWNDDAGVTTKVPKGRVKTAPAPSPVASGKAASASMPKGQSTFAPSTRSSIAAAAQVAKEVAATVLDSFKVRDGRSIGKVRFGEIDQLAFENGIEASVLRQCKRHAQAAHDARICDVIGPDILAGFIAKAELENANA